MLNRVVLVGRLTRDPELRYTPSGVAVANFTLAVNRPFTNEQGEREADFINCVIWRKPAENLANYSSQILQLIQQPFEYLHGFYDGIWFAHIDPGPF